MSVLSLQDCADANILKDIKARRKIPQRQSERKKQARRRKRILCDVSGIVKNMAEKYFRYRNIKE